MKAAILVKQNAPLELADLDLPALDVGQVLVEIHASGICGKQIDEITGRQGDDAYLPHLLGHEGGGVVQAVGPGVRKVKPGDRVVVHWIKGQGIDSAAPRFKRGDEVISAGWATTFSDHTIASENRVTPVPDDVPFEVLALLGCAVTTGLGIVFTAAQVTIITGLALTVLWFFRAFAAEERKLDMIEAGTLTPEQAAAISASVGAGPGQVLGQLGGVEDHRHGEAEAQELHRQHAREGEDAEDEDHHPRRRGDHRRRGAHPLHRGLVVAARSVERLLDGRLRAEGAVARGVRRLTLAGVFRLAVRAQRVLDEALRRPGALERLEVGVP